MCVLLQLPVAPAAAPTPRLIPLGPPGNAYGPGVPVAVCIHAQGGPHMAQGQQHAQGAPAGTGGLPVLPHRATWLFYLFFC